MGIEHCLAALGTCNPCLADKNLPCMFQLLLSGSEAAGL